MTTTTAGKLALPKLLLVILISEAVALGLDDIQAGEKIAFLDYLARFGKSYLTR